MAEDLRLQTVITPEGYAAALNNVPNAQGFRIELNRARPVVNGVPKDYFDLKGRRVGDYQINVTAKITSNTEEYQFKEIWIYDSISNVVFAKIKREDGGIIDYVSPTKDAYISYSFVFDTVGPGTITIVEDAEGIGLVLAELEEHKNALDPHPHIYPKTEADNKFLSIYQTVPTTKKEAFIFNPVFGMMQWVETWSIYRSIDCGQKVNGWSRNTLAGYIDANGAILPKTGNYYALYTSAKDHDVIHDDAQYWQAGEFLFAEVDNDHFKIPDLRGYFDRNASMGSTVDAGRELFTAQEDAQLRILGKFYVRSSSGGRSNVFTPADSPFTAVRNSESLSDPMTVVSGTTSDTTVLLDTAIGTRTADEVIVKNTASPAWIKL